MKPDFRGWNPCVAIAILLAVATPGHGEMKPPAHPPKIPLNPAPSSRTNAASAADTNPTKPPRSSSTFDVTRVLLALAA